MAMAIKLDGEDVITENGYQQTADVALVLSKQEAAALITLCGNVCGSLDSWRAHSSRVYYSIRDLDPDIDNMHHRIHERDLKDVPAVVATLEI